MEAAEHVARVTELYQRSHSAPLFSSVSHMAPPTASTPRAALEAERYLASLIFDVKGLLSTNESADLRARTKMLQVGTGPKRERPYPDAPDVDADS